MSGVNKLRAMFEQNTAASPEPRGRSPGGSSAVSDTSRPTSTVRASFVSVDPPMPHASDFAGLKGAPAHSNASHRRESFSVSEDTAGEVAELKKVLGDEREVRRQSHAIIEPIPEQAIASRDSSAGPPPLREEPAGDMLNLGAIMKGSDFPDADADAEPAVEELPAVEQEPSAVEELSPVEELPAVEEESVQDIPADNPDKPVTGAQEHVSLKPADPTDASAVAGGQALPAPVEDLQPVQEEPTKEEPVKESVKAEPAVHTPKPTTTTKAKLEPKKPAGISTSKAATSKSTPAKSPLPKPAPKTPTHTKPSTVAAAKPAVKPAVVKEPAKEPSKTLAPKPKTSHSSLRASSATAPTAAAKAKTLAPENKKPAATTKPRDPATTSPTGFRKPKPKSPTRPVGLPSRLTAPTAASAAKLQGEEPQKPARKPAVAARPATKPAAPRTSRPSVAPPSAAANKRPESRTSTAGAGPSFLERMSRPTAASASKVHDKPTSPPRKTPAKTSILQKGKKKVEEVAAKAKEAVTNGHTDEPAKTEPTNGTGAHTETPAEFAPESVAEEVDQAEPVKAESSLPAGESSVEQQTPSIQDEAVR